MGQIGIVAVLLKKDEEIKDFFHFLHTNAFYKGWIVFSKWPIFALICVPLTKD